MASIVFKTPFYGVTALPRPRTTIHNLPNELLTKIFVLCLQEYKGRRICYNPTSPSTLLTRVCTHWALVALNTPSLWDTLRICLSNPLSPSQVARFFQRSGDRNLSLHYQEALNCIDVDSKIPWSRITDLRLHFDLKESLIRVRKLLTHTPNLVRFEAACMFCEPDMPPFPPTTLPHLKHLFLGFISCEPMSIEDESTYRETGFSPWARSRTFLLSLVLPKLVYLNMYCIGPFLDSDPMQALIDLQRRSGFTLETLHLTGIMLDFDALFDFFAQVPELRCLKLDSGCADTLGYYRVLWGLQFRQDHEENLLPKLQNIFIKDMDIWRDHKVLDDIALSSLESRWWPNELCPYNQEHLGMLKNAVIIWEELWGKGKPITHSEARLRAQGLHDKMRLSYPTLGFPYNGEENYENYYINTVLQFAHVE